MTTEQAIEQLMMSERGRSAIAHLEEMFDDHLLGLDFRNQGAVLELLHSFWTHPSSTADLMREALGKEA